MKSSFLIWIPSLQKFVRFYELKTKDLKFLEKAKKISHLEFLFATKELLENLLYNKNEISIGQLTMIDKYVILLYLRMISVGTSINCIVTCPECGESSNKKIDLNSFIIPMKDIIDKSYEKTIKSENFSFLCDLPNINKELELETWVSETEIDLNERINFSENYMAFLLNYIKEITIIDKTIKIDEMSYINQMNILKQIPSIHTTKIHNEYIKKIGNNFTNISLLSSKCKNPKCISTNIDFSLKSINELLKIILSQDMQEYIDKSLYLCGHNYTPKYIDSLPPAEIDLIVGLIEKSKTKKETSELPSFGENPTITRNTEFASF